MPTVVEKETITNIKSITFTGAHAVAIANLAKHVEQSLTQNLHQKDWLWHYYQEHAAENGLGFLRYSVADQL